MARYVLTPGPDHILIARGTNVIDAAGATLSPGDVIIAAPASDTALVLTGGGQFDLAAPALLAGIDAVFDRSVGDSVITLRAGLDLSLHLGIDRASVIGAANADTIIGGQGYDTITLGSAQERVIAGGSGATILMAAKDAGATIDGRGVTSVTLTGGAGQVAILGAQVSGVATLDVASAGLRVCLAEAGITAVALSASMLNVALGNATGTVTDYAGGNVIRLAGPGQTLALPYASVLPDLPPDHLLGFGAGDAVAIDIPYGANETLHYDPATGLTVVTDTLSSVSQTLYLAPGLAGLQLSATTDLPNGDRGTLLTLGPQAPCFAAGTRVLTARGPVAVEALAVGDRLITRSGRARRLRWIGHRTLDTSRHPDPARVWPVRIDAGAFADGVPQADVVLSPDHAVLADGVLIPVRCLVNGATIRQERVARVRYFHLELACHDVVLAEGLPVETYLDTGNRHYFANGGALVALHADFGATGADGSCAPLYSAGAAVHRVRARLLGRASALGYRSTIDGDLHVLADGARVWGECRDGIWTGFVPAAPRRVSIDSRAAAPAWCTADHDDLRCLGVAVRGITLRSAAEARRFGPDDDVWGPGFYPAEADCEGRWRWTDGSGALFPACWRGIAGPFRLEIHHGGWLRYRLDRAVSGAGCVATGTAPG